MYDLRLDWIYFKQTRKIKTKGGGFNYRFHSTHSLNCCTLSVHWLTTEVILSNSYKLSTKSQSLLAYIELTFWRRCRTDYQRAFSVKPLRSSIIRNWWIYCWNIVELYFDILVNKCLYFRNKPDRLEGANEG